MSEGGSDRDDTPRPPWAAVGSAIGGIARRVGELVSDVSETVSVAERSRDALARADIARRRGASLEARELLEAARGERPDDPHLLAGIRLTWCWAELFSSPTQRFPVAGPGAAPGEGSSQASRDATLDAVDDLAAAVLELRGGRPDAAIDAVRRAGRGRLPALRSERLAFRVAEHTVASQAWAALGQRDRAIREIQRARAAAGTTPGAAVCDTLTRVGVDLLLADGRVAAAERWLDDLRPRATGEGANEDLADARARDLDEGGPELAAYRGRIYAARGDRDRALASIEGLDPELFLDRKILVQLVVGDAEHAVRDTLRWLALDPQQATRQRLWALAQLRAWRQRHARRGDADRTPGLGDVLDALTRAAAAVPEPLRRHHLQELALVVLHAGAFDHPAAAAATALDRDPEEIHLLRLRRALAAGEAVDQFFVAGPPPRLRRAAELGEAQGPDEVSPLRDAEFRAATLGAHRELALAAWCEARGRRREAGDALVRALVEDPNVEEAIARLRALSPARPERRLEACLADATDLLAAVPGQVLGISLEGVSAALAGVVAARERLARPLTIAIMGEFSSGKSSFVNALLGEEVAPTGVLPTTSTINLFRRGAGGGARVHDRDGRIETLARDQVEPFLKGLDDVAASRIRYVEIERAGAAMGDTAVVDTPGLNALDAYHEQVARAFIEEADAVVWVFSATRSGAASELAMLESLEAGGRRVLGILNKVDTLAPEEREELLEYLRGQLGGVLAELVPLSATEAVAWRRAHGQGHEGAAADEADPFAPVARALESHFLADARNLKRALTVRRLDEALDLAHATVVEGIEALELRAGGDATDDVERVAGTMLERFQRELELGLLDLDDTLAREWLALGVVEVKRGQSRRNLDELDRDYLDAHFEEVVVDALEQALRRLAAHSEAGARAASSLGERFGPWARGHVTGLASRGYVSALVRERGPAAAHGEAELRAAIRAALVGFAGAWRGALDDLRRALVHDLAAAQRETHAVPRAEALRLRAYTLAGIEALRERIAELEQ